MIVLDVLLNADRPANAAASGPDDWPYTCRERLSTTTAPSAPWQRMSLAEYGAYIAARQDAFWTWYNALPSNAPVPDEITLRQLLFALTFHGYISEAEALAAAQTGSVPATLDGVLSQMSPTEVFGVRLTWASMTVAHRSDPMWALFGAAGIADSGQVDQIFVTGATY